MFKEGFRATAAAALPLLLAACGGGGSSSTSGVPDVAVVESGCRSVSANYPWGRADMRSWTPRQTAADNSTAIGAAVGQPFEARLVIAYGDGQMKTTRQAVFELANGCRRQYVAASLADADVALIDAAVVAHPLAADPATYQRWFDPDFVAQADIDAGVLVSTTTQHFAFWRGVDPKGVSNQFVAEQGGWDAFLQKAGAFMENQWLMNRDMLGAPMPYAGAGERRKINVYLCGTGLPFIEGGDLTDCWASAADAMWVSGPAMAEGSTIMHEFGHVLQFYTGGFRDKPDAGMIWETGAEWNSFALAGDPYFLPYLTANLESGPLFSPARYGAFPFMAFLREKDDTRDLMWRTWLNNQRTAEGATTEDFVQAFVRLAQAASVYPKGFISFADDMGWFGARLAAMDFEARQALLDWQYRLDGSLHFAKQFVPLVATATANVYTPPVERPLLEYGTHLVPLTAEAGKVTVQVTGATTAHRAAWRFTLVAVGADGAVRYGKLAAAEGSGSGATAINHRSGEKLYLSVTATPYTYETLGWQGTGATTGTQFPYRVLIDGATPLTGSATACDAGMTSDTWDLNYNTNGHVEDGVRCP
jgi:Family of unknown function (DUF6055)